MIYHITTSYIRLRPTTFFLKTADILMSLSRYWLQHKCLKIFPVLVCMILIGEPVYCQPQKTHGWISRQINDTMEIKIPNDFKPEGVDEPHIFKWTKNSAEIYIVIGDKFVGSRTGIINAIKKSSLSVKAFDQVKTVRIPNAKGIILKEKTPDDPDRLMCWELKIFSEKREINVQLSAPAKDFKIFSPSFEEVVKSIKVDKSSK
ncbi:MAG: hypothetical protein ACP5U1_06285 [Desulfomonilaceae bacterium]